MFLITITANAQQESTYWDNLKDRESTLGIEEGFTEVKTDEFTLKLVNASQTVAGLYPNSDPDFDFTPGERIEIRDKDGIYYSKSSCEVLCDLGDVSKTKTFCENLQKHVFDYIDIDLNCKDKNQQNLNVVLLIVIIWIGILLF